MREEKVKLSHEARHFLFTFLPSAFPFLFPLSSLMYVDMSTYKAIVFVLSA
jgi:hypothetical protein